MKTKLCRGRQSDGRMDLRLPWQTHTENHQHKILLLSEQAVSEAELGNTKHLLQHHL